MNKKRTSAHHQAALQLLRANPLPPEELRQRLSQLRSLAYWRGMNPQLSVQSRSVEANEEVGMMSVIEHLTSRFEKEGYLQADHALPEPLVGRMRECTKNLKRERWPLVFAFVYDEFWRATRTPALVRLLSAILSPRYKQIPKIWTHYVAPDGGSGLRSVMRHSKMVACTWFPGTQLLPA